MQICTFEYGISLPCKLELKRNENRVSDGGGGGVNIHANVNAVKREFGNTLFSSHKQQVIGS